MPSDPSSPVVIRFVQPDDYAQWKVLWDGYNAFYERDGATALPEDVTRVTWARFLDAEQPMHALVAEADGRLLGLAHYLFHPSTIAVAPSCYLSDLFTVEAARGRGIGRELIEAVYGRAQAAQCARVYWQTHESNGTAQHLYNQLAERSGFIVYRKTL
ncbi:GNAT family N-acetyltransferase [Ramlibacter sp.]|uniref:GNAT family N-acetyltransferase n=1 Tax=Ramlibacter sp. TaxID=1917967 RepID=UPI00183F402E|nr:GNAT family N-acetyltransferase [Ramlibacter sp.]MBA2676336.1 GNAT family N-acetyltransferase [Ramlibacter sp.]